MENVFFGVLLTMDALILYPWELMRRLVRCLQVLALVWPKF